MGDREKIMITNPQEEYEKKASVGDRLADSIASFMGSWKFIMIQSSVILSWMTLNVVAFIHHWDPYPWILLNLIFSIQAAFSSPLIMMTQNRQEAKDRIRAENDYKVDKYSSEMVDVIDKKVDDLTKKVNLLNLSIESIKQSVIELTPTK